MTAATYGVDVSFLTVKINEGALYPTLALQATVSKVWQQTITQINQFTAAASCPARPCRSTRAGLNIR